MTEGPTDQRLIDFTRFVATKFARNDTPWVYSRNTGKLRHVRYESDYTGYNHWTKRWKRALPAWNPLRYFAPKSGLDLMFKDRNPTIKGFFINAWARTVVSIRKNSNLPDGQVNGNLTFWEEDGEYITMMGPTVGVKVLDFLEAEPDNEHAKAILAAMHEAHSASWGKNKDKEDD